MKTARRCSVGAFCLAALLSAQAAEPKFYHWTLDEAGENPTPALDRESSTAPGEPVGGSTGGVLGGRRSVVGEKGVESTCYGGFDSTDSWTVISNAVEQGLYGLTVVWARDPQTADLRKNQKAVLLRWAGDGNYFGLQVSATISAVHVMVNGNSYGTFAADAQVAWGEGTWHQVAVWRDARLNVKVWVTPGGAAEVAEKPTIDLELQDPVKVGSVNLYLGGGAADRRSASYGFWGGEIDDVTSVPVAGLTAPQVREVLNENLKKFRPRRGMAVVIF